MSVGGSEADRKRRRHRNERIAAAALIIVLGSAVGFFIRWNAGEDEEFQRDRLFIAPTTPVTPEITLLRDYLRIDTRSGREHAGAEFLAGVLRRNGIQPEIIESAPGRANVYARIRGRQQTGGLLLLHHIDIVDPGAEPWTHPPFAGEIELNMLYGRGAMDMKSIGITHLLAFIDVAKSGRVPEHDLVFLATADEEQGGRLGVEWLLANRPDLFERVEYALNEGGVNESVAEKMQYFGIEVGAKLYASLTIEATSAEQIARARLALEPHFSDRIPYRILPEVRRFFREIAPTRMQYAPLLADVDAAVENGTFWRLPLNYRQFTENSMFVSGPKSSGDRHTATVQLMNIPGEDFGPRLEWLKTILAPHGARIASVEHRDRPGPLSSPDTPVFRAIAEEATKIYGCRTGTLLLFRSTSDSRFLRRSGIQTYGVLPFPTDYFHTLGIHGRDERLRLDWFVQGITLMRRIVQRHSFP